MTQHMLLFSLGPVQSFIAQARKTRDLWLGSYLLSVLMEAGMEKIESSHLVFPSNPKIKENTPDLPNKYIAIFDTPQQAYDAAMESKRQIEDYWNTLCNDVWRSVIEEHVRQLETARKIWERQTRSENFFELFWVIVEGEMKNYQHWLKETQETFDGRKRLRDFVQQDEPGEKSTISGDREALHGVGASRADVQTFWYQIAQGLSAKELGQDGTERLDAIDTVKRFAYYSQKLRKKEGFRADFPSTSTIATATYVEHLLSAKENSTIAVPLQQWLYETSKLGERMLPTAIPFLSKQANKQEQVIESREVLKRDGDCYFPETFTAYRLEKDYGFGRDKKAARDALSESGSKALLALLRAAEALPSPIARPTPYYAMIQMDGDKMGTLLSGVKDQDEHKAISKALSDFSREQTPHIVEQEYPARLIYAGGDDVFALAPLARDHVQIGAIQEGTFPPIKTVIDLVNRLQQQYQHMVRTAVQDGNQTEEITSKSRKEGVTASCGIAVAHHYTSLSYVRRMSKAAEELAKNHYGRNALVITILRRSGEQTRVGCHWYYEELADEAQPIPLFSSFYELFKDDILSPKSVYVLLEEVSTLIGLDTDAQCSEIKRVLQRHRDARMKHRLSNEELEHKAEQLVALAIVMDKDERRSQEKQQEWSTELHSEKRRYGLVEVFGWLLVMVFLTRREQD